MITLVECKGGDSDEHSDRFNAGSSDLYSVVYTNEYNHECSDECSDVPRDYNN